MKTSLFYFDLPEELIAQEPAADRDSARLLVLDRKTGAISDSSVAELAHWLDPGTVL
ncbi:MAG TPA: S-adenosylmethionine:tRNA ribosyltransferase-isomerase, partial [Spirochaetia bacterium]|nr:S-adenosylmethionine:tRNA ribosyltransferase-isomerase [Spirochaetia bacterium]